MNEKERKATPSSPINRIWNIAEEVTEGLDAVEAIYDALPEEHRNCGRSRRCMIETLADHWEEVDVVQAVENLIVETIEDAIYGRGYRAVRDSRRNLGINTDQFGDWFNPL